jgi:hypothetical protein
MTCGAESEMFRSGPKNLVHYHNNATSISEPAAHLHAVVASEAHDPDSFDAMAVMDARISRVCYLQSCRPHVHSAR